MGRRKIQIKLIKNERLRNITYNKRKRGLLKKLVELSIMCGIKAKLEMKDSFGNLIVVDAGHQIKPDPDEEKDKVIVFTPADYPEFKGFERIKRRGNISEEEEVSVKETSEPEPKPVLERTSGFRQFKPHTELRAQLQQRGNQPPEFSPTVQVQDPIPMADPGPTQVDYLNQLQLQSHTQQLMEYAAMRYYSLLNAFMSGQNF